MKYTEMVQMWEQSSLEWDNYRNELDKFVVSLYNFLLKEWEIKNPNNFRIISVDTNDEDDANVMRQPIFRMIKLAENGWANFVILIRLEQSEHSWPKESYRIVFHIKKTGSQWNIQIVRGAQIFSIPDPLTESGLVEIQKRLEALLDINIAQSFKNWLKQDGTPV